MNKKIIFISAFILILTVALTACKGKTYNPADGENEKNTNEVVGTVTVTGEDGGVTTVEIFKDSEGEKYITNVDGEKIPLTTDDQGFSDDIAFLVTSKPSSENKPSSSSANNKDNENNSSNTQPSSNAGENTTKDNSSSSTESSTRSEIIIDSKVPQDRIDWEDIVNPKN